MTADHNADASAFRDELSRLNEFTENTQSYLTPTNRPGEYRLSANDDPSEAEDDV